MGTRHSYWILTGHSFSVHNHMRHETLPVKGFLLLTSWNTASGIRSSFFQEVMNTRGYGFGHFDSTRWTPSLAVIVSYLRPVQRCHCKPGIIFPTRSGLQPSFFSNSSTGILEQFMRSRNRVGIGLSYRPGYISWRNRFLGIDSWAP